MTASVPIDQRITITLAQMDQVQFGPTYRFGGGAVQTIECDVPAATCWILTPSMPGTFLGLGTGVTQ